ncbi:hypothetical protein Q31b_58330 [Novipirellula aureliae]|uniref:Uncharacterized protein n=1 Tax=Novipirellula aureliae TaxID=2527966 RepID=A0A5C6D8J5_9BACT|nr:hypothetical protein [Novipirellula aureliae]TWU32445.1 hypothetical protein Q31b_58330 [Novipirellula aureliae]
MGQVSLMSNPPLALERSDTRTVAERLPFFVGGQDARHRLSAGCRVRARFEPITHPADHQREEPSPDDLQANEDDNGSEDDPGGSLASA